MESLVACQPRPFRLTTVADAEAAAEMPDLVKRGCRRTTSWVVPGTG